ncbi:MAG TPA: YafY family protein [Polyangiales bacterium]|nr:YafY family protein [Polyangiales bacterium]
MLQTSARLLRLLTMLQARRSWTGPDLSERLEVTARTLRRDVDRLRSLGYPVHSTSGTAGGYRLGAGAALPPLMLEDDEGIAVALALQIAAGGTIAGIEDAAQRALAKLEQVLPNRLRRRIKSLRSSIVRLSDRGPTVDLDAVAALAAACEAQHEVGFDYSDHSSKLSQRWVEPHRLVHMERRWYLVAWDKARTDWRTFRVDRIQLPLRTGSPFAPRSAPDDDVGAYVSRSVSSAMYKFQVRALMRAPAEDVRGRVSPNAGQVEAIDDRSCRLHTGGHSLDSILVWLACSGFDFQIEEPAELGEHLHVIAERFGRLAGLSRHARGTSASDAHQHQVAGLVTT